MCVKSKYVSILTVIMIVIIGSYLQKSCCSKKGSVPTLSEIPKYGSYLPDLGDKAIEYVYSPKSAYVQIKTIERTNTFDLVCDFLRLKVVKYTKNFPKTEFAGCDQHFLPQGEHIWCGFGILNPSDRATVRVFFEPYTSSLSNGWGAMNIHIQ